MSWQSRPRSDVFFKRLSRRHDNVDLALRNCAVEDDLKAVRGKGEAEVKFQEVGAG